MGIPGARSMLGIEILICEIEMMIAVQVMFQLLINNLLIYKYWYHS